MHQDITIQLHTLKQLPERSSHTVYRLSRPLFTQCFVQKAGTGRIMKCVLLL